MLLLCGITLRPDPNRPREAPSNCISNLSGERHSHWICRALHLKLNDISCYTTTSTTRPRCFDFTLSRPALTHSTMAARLLPSLAATRAFVRPSTVNVARNVRSFQTTRPRLETPTAALPVRKPVGGFRGRSVNLFCQPAIPQYEIDSFRVN